MKPENDFPIKANNKLVESSRYLSSLWHESGILCRVATSLLLFFICASVFLKSTFIMRGSTQKSIQMHSHTSPKHLERLEIPLNCSTGNSTHMTCPVNYPTSFETNDDARVCPDYFRWINEDLKPWKKTGISREMINRGNRTANFRLVILNGKAYIETFSKAFQTRDVFTIWGILQLLRRYPGRIPDLELLFDCNDPTVIKASDYRGPHAVAPPPLFHYCGDKSTLDIVFPDWSFWGWLELNIKPWEVLMKEMKEGNRKTKWIEREPYAYWIGNPYVSDARRDLLKCNVTDKKDWNARIYAQDWDRESKGGFKTSNLANQCTHRFKIYIEGRAWSVSEKYILACDSPTLLVKPHYYDFFTRSLLPMQHYWPIRDDDKCKSIKNAVNFGNTHHKKIKKIGKAGSKFVQEELKMDNVYDYMFHMLNEYAKLLTYKPSIPKNAVEMCSETMACHLNGLEKEFMMETLEKGPSITSPCTWKSVNKKGFLSSLFS